MFCTLNFASNNYDSQICFQDVCQKLTVKLQLIFISKILFTIFSRIEKEICAWCKTFNFVTISSWVGIYCVSGPQNARCRFTMIGTIMFLKSRRAVWTRPKSSMYDNNYSKMFVRTSEATMTFREEETTVIADGVSFVFVRPRSFLRTRGGAVWRVSLVAARSFSRARRVLWAERLAEKEPHSGPATRIL